MEWLGQPYYGMAKNSREGNQARKKRYYQALAERGIRPLQVLAPEAAHPLIKQAVGLMTREVDPVDPRIAMRQAGGTNEPEPGEASPDLIAALDAAKAWIAEVEWEAAARQAEIEAGERQRKALAAERDAARAAEAVALEEAKLAAAEGHTAHQLAREAQHRAEAAHLRAEKARERATEALQRAEKAEATIRQAKSLPGLRGRLVRWIAGDVLD